MRGHVRKRGNKWAYVVDVGDDLGGRRRQKWVSGFTTEKEAARALAKALVALDQGRWADPGRMPLADYLREWLEGVRVAPNTLADYRMNVERRIIPAIGDRFIGKITAPVLDAFYRRLEKHGGRTGQGLSPRSVALVHTILHKAFADGVRKRVLMYNPAAAADPPAQQRSEMHTWSRDQMRSFLDAVKSDRLYALWLTASTTGMRRGELLGLPWRAVDLEAARLSVRQELVLVDNRPALLARTKTKSGVRVVDLDGWTVATLRAFRAAQLEERLEWGPAWQDTGLAFTREDGSWIHPDTFSEWFRKHSDRASLPRIRFHDVRHTYATLALQAGIPAKIVSERLGHKNIGITLDTYSHVTPGMQEEAAAKVAALILDGE